MQSTLPSKVEPSPTSTYYLPQTLAVYNTPSDFVPSISDPTRRASHSLHGFFLSALASNPSRRSTTKNEANGGHSEAQDPHRSRSGAAAVASSLVGTASAAEGPAPAPMSGASMFAPALAATSFTALVFGNLF